MIIKFLFFISLFFSISLADYQKIKIGKIDSHYKNLLTNHQLRKVIKEIENIFETQMKINIFDYDNRGKPIDIIYMPPSKMKQNISKNIQKLAKQKLKIENLQKYFYSKQKNIQSSNATIQQQSLGINSDIEYLNNYIQKMNNKKISSKKEYNIVKKQINKLEKNINTKKNKFQQKQIKLKTIFNSYNQKISLYNTKIKQYNRLQRKVEIMARSSKEIKGAAIGYTQTKFKTFFKDGIKYQEKVKTNYMEKIEIYGFDNLSQLKAILAHEIAHLVGLSHIQVKGALMNPLLQKNQVKKLYLTPKDIDIFNELFHR